jgi:hypothetical protein
MADADIGISVKHFLLRIISYNVNGIRAAINKGFNEWLKTDPADIICLQETKALKENIDCNVLNEMGYHDYWYSAQKKGYSGVAVLSFPRRFGGASVFLQFVYEIKGGESITSISHNHFCRH